MANRRPQGGGRRMDFTRNDRGNTFRGGVSPWQGGGPGSDLPNLLPLTGGSTEATLALASNLINLLQPRQNPVPSLLDMPIRRDFGPAMNRYDRGYGPNRMGNQGNFRRTGNYNRAGERINNTRKPFRPNDGYRQQNKSSPKKDADSKSKPSKESEETDKSEKKEGNQSTPKTRYDDINQQLLKCHICNKSMWDGRSFENHLNGRAHAIMMQKTAESYALTADTMRQEFKIREMKRFRKTGHQAQRDFYCAMCDLYAVDGPVHRTTVGHRKLKKYLHPACTSCHKEMPTRIELDEHRLSAEHLRQLQEKQDTVITKPKPEMMVFSTLTMEQMYLRDDRQRWKRNERRNEGDKDGADKDKEGDAEGDKDKDAEEKQGETEDPEIKIEPTDEEKKEDGDDVKETEEKKEAPIDKENTVLDYKEDDDISNITLDMFPIYSTERGVGRSFLKPLNCIQCQLCHKLLDSEETAEVHLRTWRHHQLFTYLLNEKSGNLQPDNQHSEAGKRTHSSHNDDSGTWKRRKTTPRNEDDEDQEDQEPEPETAKSNGHEVKEEAEDAAEEAALADNPGDEYANPDDELEDWEQSVDEILNDEQPEATGEKEPEKEEPVEPEPQPEPKPVEELKKVPAPPASPRGRGRGRRQ